MRDNVLDGYAITSQNVRYLIQEEIALKPLIICAAVTGAMPARSKTPHHPVTPDELAKSAAECWKAGAAMVHLHARKEDGTTSTDVAAYRPIMERIHAARCDAILNLSAGDDGGRASHEQRWGLVEVNAEVLSLDAGPFNTGGRVYDNSPAYLKRMAQIMQTAQVTPAIEVFEFGHMHGVRDLVRAGLLKKPYYIEFVLGTTGGLPLDERILPVLVDQLPEGTEWSLCVKTGDAEVYQRLMFYAFTHGGHVRTGMEDMVFLTPGILAQTNADMVAQWVKTAAIWGRPVATPDQARSILGIAAERTRSCVPGAARAAA